MFNGHDKCLMVTTNIPWSTPLVFRSDSSPPGRPPGQEPGFSSQGLKVRPGPANAGQQQDDEDDKEEKVAL